MTQPQIAAFANLEESTAEDWAIIASKFVPYARQLPRRILDHLKRKCCNLRMRRVAERRGTPIKLSDVQQRAEHPSLSK